MRGQKGDIVRLFHIPDAIEELESFETKDLDDFLRNSMLRFASIKLLEIIGGAAKQISKETKIEFADIEWKDISGLRNVLVHEYFQIDLELIWETILNDIPILKNRICEVLKYLEEKYD